MLAKEPDAPSVVSDHKPVNIVNKETSNQKQQSNGNQANQNSN